MRLGSSGVSWAARLTVAQMKLLGLGKVHRFPLVRRVTEEGKGGDARSPSHPPTSSPPPYVGLSLSLPGLFEPT